MSLSHCQAPYSCKSHSIAESMEFSWQHTKRTQTERPQSCVEGVGEQAGWLLGRSESLGDCKPSVVTNKVGRERVTRAIDFRQSMHPIDLIVWVDCQAVIEELEKTCEEAEEWNAQWKWIKRKRKQGRGGKWLKRRIKMHGRWIRERQLAFRNTQKGWSG